MKYSKSYKINIRKLNHYINASGKTKKQIANEAFITDRSIRRALNNEKLNLLSIQGLAKVFQTQVSNLIKDDNFNEERPPVFFEKIKDVRETLNLISKKYQGWWGTDYNEYHSNIYFHYDLRLNDTVLPKIEFLSNIFKKNHNKDSIKNKSKKQSSDHLYMEEQRYYLNIISKGNSCLDELSQHANVYIGSYLFKTITDYPYYKYYDDGNNRKEDGYYLAPSSKLMTLIIFSEKKTDKLMLFPKVGFSDNKLQKKYLEIINQKERKADIEECKTYIKLFLENDHNLGIQDLMMEDDKLHPHGLEDINAERINLSLPTFNINSDKYDDEIIAFNNNEINKEDNM